MIKYLLTFMLLFILGLSVGQADQPPVYLSIPDKHADEGQTIGVAICVGPEVEQIMSADLWITYDPTKLSPTGIVEKGSLFQDFFSFYNFSYPGEVRIAMASADMINVVYQSAIVWVYFDVISTKGIIKLDFSKGLLNGGATPVEKKPGYLITEIKEERKAKKQVFQRGNQREVRFYSSPVFYQEGEKLEPIIPTVDIVSKVSNVDGKIYRAQWHDDWPADYTIAVGQDSIIYTADFGLDSITVQKRGTRSGVKMDMILRHENAAALFKWHVNTTLPLNVSLGNAIFQIQPFTAEDADGKRVALESLLSNDTLYCQLSPGETNRYPITVDPTTTVTAQGSSCGKAGNWSASGPWLTIRNRTTASAFGSTVYQWGSNPITGNYIDDRSFFCFDLSGVAEGTVCDSVFFRFFRDGTEYLTTTLWTQICLSNQTGVVAEGWFNDIVGWASSGAWSVIALSDSLPLTDASPPNNTWASLPLNAVGCDTLENRFGGSDSLRIVILPRCDITGVTPPEETNTIKAVVDSTVYLQIFYTEAAAGWTGTVGGVTDPAAVGGVDVENIQEIGGIP